MAGAPITLTPKQFAKTGAAAKPGATYAKYLAYVARARSGGVKTAPVGSGLDQTSQAAMARIINSIVSRFGGGGGTLAPESDAQLQAEAGNTVRAQTQPIVDQITSSLGARARAGMSSITDLSKNLMSAQGPAAAGYTNDALRSAAARSAVTGALASQAAGQGQAEQAGVAGKLAQIGAADNSKVFADNAGALGQGIATETTSKGATSAADAVNRGSAEAGRASALPGIASLAAIRSGRLLQEQTNANIADQTGKVAASVPGMVAQLFENLKSRELSKAGQRESIAAQKGGAALNVFEHLGDQNVQKALGKMGLGLDLTKLGVDASNNDVQNSIAQQNADTSQQRAQTAANAAATKNGPDGPKARAAVSAATKVAASYIDKTVKPQPVYQRVLDNSTTPPTYKQVVTGYKGYPSYYDVIHTIESRIAPGLKPYLSAADITRMAQQLVNANPHYKPGQNGRPGTGAAPPPVKPTSQGSHGTPP